MSRIMQIHTDDLVLLINYLWELIIHRMKVGRKHMTPIVLVDSVGKLLERQRKIIVVSGFKSIHNYLLLLLLY